MSLENQSSAMDQKIFTLGLPTEAISLYLLCCSLADKQMPISVETMAGMWNSSREALQASLNQLEAGNILHKGETNREGGPIYRLTNPENWNY